MRIFVVARITGILEIEAFAMYGALISGAYLLFGGTLIRAIWFPLVYLAFTLPPPDTVVAAVTQPIKIAISSVGRVAASFARLSGRELGRRQSRSASISCSLPRPARV